MSTGTFGPDGSDPTYDAPARTRTRLSATARALRKAVAWAVDRIGFLAP